MPDPTTPTTTPAAPAATSATPAPGGGDTPPAGNGSGADFWSCGPGVAALDDPSPVGHENALQKLGKPPFERTTRTKFRLLGYLATVYEHVSTDLRNESAAGAARR